MAREDELANGLDVPTVDAAPVDENETMMSAEYISDALTQLQRVIGTLERREAEIHVERERSEALEKVVENQIVELECQCRRIRRLEVKMDYMKNGLKELELYARQKGDVDRYEEMKYLIEGLGELELYVREDDEEYERDKKEEGVCEFDE